MNTAELNLFISLDTQLQGGASHLMTDSPATVLLSVVRGNLDPTNKYSDVTLWTHWIQIWQPDRIATGPRLVGLTIQ